MQSVSHESRRVLTALFVCSFVLGGESDSLGPEQRQ